MLQQVVLGELEVSVVEDCVGLRAELGVDLEQALEGFLAGQLVVELGQERLALAQGDLEPRFLVWFVCSICLFVCLFVGWRSSGWR